MAPINQNQQTLSNFGVGKTKQMIGPRILMYENWWKLMKFELFPMNYSSQWTLTNSQRVALQRWIFMPSIPRFTFISSVSSRTPMFSRGRTTMTDEESHMNVAGLSSKGDRIRTHRTLCMDPLEISLHVSCEPTPFLYTLLSAWGWLCDMPNPHIDSALQWRWSSPHRVNQRPAGSNDRSAGCLALPGRLEGSHQGWFNYQRSLFYHQNVVLPSTLMGFTIKNSGLDHKNLGRIGS